MGLKYIEYNGLFKIIVCGDPNVGRTTFFDKYTDAYFHPQLGEKIS